MPVQSPIAISLRSTDHTDELSSLEYHGHWDAVGTANVINTGTSAMVSFFFFFNQLKI